MKKSTIKRLAAYEARSVVLLALVASVAACGGRAPRGDMPMEPLSTVTGKQLYKNGIALIARHNFVRAEQYFLAAIAKGLPEKVAMPALMRSCVLSNRLESAVMHGEGYLERAPDDVPMRMLLAAIFLETGEVERAKEHLHRVISGDPSHAEAVFQLGRAELNSGHRREARSHFRKYLKNEPSGKNARLAEEALAKTKLRPKGRNQSRAFKETNR